MSFEIKRYICSCLITLAGHWGHTDNGYYYNGTHHDDLLKGDHLGIDCNDQSGKSPFLEAHC
jgi:hypothetical protein